MASTADAEPAGLLAWVGELHSLGSVVRTGPHPGGEARGPRAEPAVESEEAAESAAKGPADRSGWAPALIRTWARIDG
ncbi:hypothetical protein [Streptomyces sp. NPDC058583]|uniref:hypothetical protein n=1 Tax=unclassified Streptomyces TaxID=2593676 RepID=UPI003659C05D